MICLISSLLAPGVGGLAQVGASSIREQEADRCSCLACGASVERLHLPREVGVRSQNHRRITSRLRLDDRRVCHRRCCLRSRRMIAEPGT